MQASAAPVLLRTAGENRAGSGAEPDRHQQVAVVGAAVGARLAGDQHGLAGFGERKPGGVGVDGGQAVEQVVGVEGRLESLRPEPGGVRLAGAWLLAVWIA